MSEDTANNTNTNTNTSDNTPTHSRRTKKDEIFGFAKDDVTLGLAGLGLLVGGGVAIKMIGDMVANGQLPNPFQPQQPRVTYSDIYEQQRQQQEWAARQAQAQGQQPAITDQQQARAVESGDPNAQTMPAYNSEEFQGFDDEEDGVSYSTTVRKPGSGRFDRIHSS